MYCFVNSLNENNKSLNKCKHIQNQNHLSKVHSYKEFHKKTMYI